MRRTNHRDWFGECGGWRATQTRQRVAVSAAFGKIAICAASDGAGVTCIVVERNAAAALLIDLQMALAQ